MSAPCHSGPFPPAPYHTLSPLGCTPGWLWDKLDALQDDFSTSRCPCHVRNHHPEYHLGGKKPTFLDQFEHCFQNGHKYEEHPSSLPGHSLWQNWDVLRAREHRLYAAFQNLCNTAYYHWFCHTYLNRNVYGKIFWSDLRTWWWLWDTSARLQWRPWECVLLVHWEFPFPRSLCLGTSLRAQMHRGRAEVPPALWPVSEWPVPNVWGRNIVTEK